MAFGTTPKDVNGVPIAEGYVPGDTFRAIQGSTNTNTDGSSNVSTPLNVNLTQTNSLAVSMASADGLTAANTLVVENGIYNGTTVDRQRANMDNITILASAARTTTQTGADQTNYNHRGMILVIDVTSAGTGSIILAIQGKDPVSGKYYTILTGANITSNSTNVYRVYPGLTAAANLTVSDILPRTWRPVITANNANTITYSVGAILEL